MAQGLVLEVWAFDRRSNQLEDLVGLDIAEEFASPEIALDWLYGGELTLPLHPLLAAGPNRRAVFYNTQSDVPFIAGWTNLVFSQDIDAVVTAARAVALNQNVFLGGHSAGTGLHGALRRHRLQPDRRRPCRSGLRQAARPGPARGRRRLDRRDAAHAPTRSTASRRSSTAACSAPCATTRPAASTA